MNLITFKTVKPKKIVLVISSRLYLKVGKVTIVSQSFKDSIEFYFNVNRYKIRVFKNFIRFYNQSHCNFLKRLALKNIVFSLEEYFLEIDFNFQSSL